MALFKVFRLQTFAHGHLDPKSRPPLQAPLPARFLSEPRVLLICRKNISYTLKHSNESTSCSLLEQQRSPPILNGGDVNFRVWNIANDHQVYQWSSKHSSKVWSFNQKYRVHLLFCPRGLYLSQKPNLQLALILAKLNFSCPPIKNENIWLKSSKENVLRYTSNFLGNYVLTFLINELLKAWGPQVRKCWFLSWWYWKNTLIFSWWYWKT